MIGARKGSPLAIGYGDGEMYLGSDAHRARRRSPTRISLSRGRRLGRADPQGRRRSTTSTARSSSARRIKSRRVAFLVDKGNHRHFMAKEIHEQPEVVGHTLAHYLDMATERVALPVKLPFDFKAIRASRSRPAAPPTMPGSSRKYWFERLAPLPVEIDVASEFRYREAPLPQGRSGDVRLAVGRDRRHAGRAALCQGSRAQHIALGRQRADLDHRARKRRRAADAGRARKSASPRPRPSPAS